GGKQYKKLVAKRSDRDLSNNWQFTLGRKPNHVARCDCCIIDNDTGGLDACLGSLAHHVAIAATSSRRPSSPMLKGGLTCLNLATRCSELSIFEEASA